MVYKDKRKECYLKILYFGINSVSRSRMAIVLIVLFAQ